MISLLNVLISIFEIITIMVLINKILRDKNCTSPHKFIISSILLILTSQLGTFFNLDFSAVNLVQMVVIIVILILLYRHVFTAIFSVIVTYFTVIVINTATAIIIMGLFKNITFRTLQKNMLCVIIGISAEVLALTLLMVKNKYVIILHNYLSRNSATDIITMFIFQLAVFSYFVSGMHIAGVVFFILLFYLALSVAIVINVIKNHSSSKQKEYAMAQNQQFREYIMRTYNANIKSIQALSMLLELNDYEELKKVVSKLNTEIEEDEIGVFSRSDTVSFIFSRHILKYNTQIVCDEQYPLKDIDSDVFSVLYSISRSFLTPDIKSINIQVLDFIDNIAIYITVISDKTIASIDLSDAYKHVNPDSMKHSIKNKKVKIKIKFPKKAILVTNSEAWEKGAVEK